jgi:hypothetical protein
VVGDRQEEEKQHRQDQKGVDQIVHGSALSFPGQDDWRRALLLWSISQSVVPLATHPRFIAAPVDLVAGHAIIGIWPKKFCQLDLGAPAAVAQSARTPPIHNSVRYARQRPPSASLNSSKASANRRADTVDAAEQTANPALTRPTDGDRRAVALVQAFKPRSGVSVADAV